MDCICLGNVLVVDLPLDVAWYILWKPHCHPVRVLMGHTATTWPVYTGHIPLKISTRTWLLQTNKKAVGL